MGAKLLLENMRDTPGCFQEDILETLWAGLPERFRTVDLASDGLEPADRAAFTLGKHHRGFRLRFWQLPAPMDREMAWCCWRIADLGGRIPVGAVQGLIISLARAAEDHPEFRGSLMEHTPREWERALAAAYARHYGRLPGKGWTLNTATVLRRCYQMLWAAYDQRPWWEREVWDPHLDRRIPLRDHEPNGDHSLYFQSLQPLWLRHGFRWYLKVALETGELTWTTARTRRSGIQVFGDWITGHAVTLPARAPWSVRACSGCDPDTGQRGNELILKP